LDVRRHTLSIIGLKDARTKFGKARDFLWAAGIENTFVPQARNGHRPLDEYELIGHYRALARGSFAGP
jgi:hypothetical protein